MIFCSEARFANTGILSHLYILEHDYVEPRPGVDPHEGVQIYPPLAPAAKVWALHFQTDEMQFIGQFRTLLTIRSQYQESNPAAATLPVYKLWSFVLQRAPSNCSLAVRCVAAFIVLSFQNADIERDLGLLKIVREHQNFSQVRLDGRARILLQGHDVEKARGSALSSVFIGQVASIWSNMKRRQDLSSTSRQLRGPQGHMPQRANTRLASPLEQSLQVQPLQAAQGEFEDVDIAELLL